MAKKVGKMSLSNPPSWRQNTNEIQCILNKSKLSFIEMQQIEDYNYKNMVTPGTTAKHDSYEQLSTALDGFSHNYTV